VGADSAVVLASITAGAALAVRSIPLAVFRVTSDLRRYGTVVVSGSMLQAALQIGLLAFGSGLVGFLFGASVAAGLSAVMAFGLLRRARYLAPPQRPAAAFLRVGGWVFVSSLVNRLVANADRFAVGWWGTMDTLGVYGTAARWTMPLRMLSGGTKMAIAPALSRAETEGGSLESASAPIAALVTLLALLAALLQVSSISLVLTPWEPFADEFQRLLSVLLAAQVGGSLVLIGQLFLYYGGRPAHSAGLSVLSATVTLAGLAWLVPRFGPLGAAASQLGASVVMLAALGFAAGRVAWLSSRAVRAIAVLAAGLVAPWILPAGGSALVTIAGAALLAGWAWNDLRSTIHLRRLAG
jgi:O-antigen/teichoic acid export membrane protein